MLHQSHDHSGCSSNLTTEGHVPGVESRSNLSVITFAVIGSTA